LDCQKGNRSPQTEEERRNCLVPITRIKECLVLRGAQKYQGWRKEASRFLVDMERVQTERTCETPACAQPPWLLKVTGEVWPNFFCVAMTPCPSAHSVAIALKGNLHFLTPTDSYGRFRFLHGI
jgi:hypothetical protein